MIDPSEEYADEEVVLANANPPQQPLVVPQVLIWTPIGQLVWLVLVLVALLGCVALYWFTAGRQIAEFLPRKEGSVSPRQRRFRRGTGPPAGASAGWPGWPTGRSDCSTSSAWSRSPWALLITVLSFTGRAPWEIYEWLRPFATVSMYAVFAMSAGAGRARLTASPLRERPQGGRRHLGPHDLLAASGASARTSVLRRARGAGAADPDAVGAEGGATTG